jgi:hypothetical protein
MAGSRRLHYPRQQNDMVGDGARTGEVVVDSRNQYRAPPSRRGTAIRPAWTTTHSTCRRRDRDRRSLQQCSAVTLRPCR